MKKLFYALLGLIITSTIYTQNQYQQEIICPSMLEFKFPQSFYDGGIRTHYGGVPVLRFKNAEIKKTEVVCKYDKKFATTGLSSEDPGFGFMMDGAPFNITLTLITDYLNNWDINSNYVEIKSRARGYLISPICYDEPQKYYYGWNGAFYSDIYEGNVITLKRIFEGEARLNSDKNGFIISSTQTGLYTPSLNPEASDSVVSGKKGKSKKPKKKKK